MHGRGHMFLGNCCHALSSASRSAFVCASLSACDGALHPIVVANAVVNHRHLSISIGHSATPSRNESQRCKLYL